MRRRCRRRWRRWRASGSAALLLALGPQASSLLATNGTWINASSGGLWSSTSNWSPGGPGGIIANGTDAIADFSTLFLSADNTVHLDSPRTIGLLKFADDNFAHNWILDNNGNAANVLTMAVTSGTPAIQALNTNQPSTINAVVAGTQGLLVNGAGILVLGGNNTFTGGVSVFGGLKLANAGALNASTANDIVVGGATVSSLTLNGNSVTVGALSSTSAGASAGVVQNASASPATLTVTRSSPNYFVATVQDGSGGGALGMTFATGSGGVAYILGNNTYSGLTTVSSGTLGLSVFGVGNVNALGSTAQGTNVLSGGTLDVAGESTAEPMNLAGSGDGGVGALVNSGAAVTLPGTINAGGGASFTVGGAGDITLTGDIRNFSNLAKVGTGTLTFTGTAGSAGMGLIVNAGTVVLAKTSDTNVVHTVGGNGLTINGGTVKLAGTGGDQIYDFAPVNITGGSLDTNGLSETISFVTLNVRGSGTGGAGAIVNSAAGASTLSPQNIQLAGNTSFGVTQSGGSLTLPVDIGEDAAGRVLTKVGAGNLILSGNETFTGGLVIAGGTVTQTAGTITSSVTNNATFVAGGGGTLAGSLFNSGTVTVGSGATLTMSNSLATLDNEGTINLAGGTLACTAAIVNNDVVSGFGTISGSGGFTNAAQLTVSGGHLTLATTNSNSNTGTINLAAAWQLRLTGAALNNFGALNLNTAVVTGSSTLLNRAGGTLSGPGTILSPFGNTAGLVIIPAGGATNITPAWTNGGEVQLTAVGAVLTGGAITNSGTLDGVGSVGSAVSNTGTIEAVGGTLRLEGALTNGASGLLRTATGGKLLVTAGLATNAGIISLVGGTFDNNNQPLTNTGQISGYGTFSTGGAGLTNNGTFTITGGITTINGNVTNSSGKSINVRYNPAVFTGSVVNNGSIKITNTTVTFAGPYSGNAYTSDPSDNFFQSDVTILSGGSMTGSAGDRFFLSGGTFTNNGTFTNGGLLQSGDNATNNNTFIQSGPQQWSAGTTFTNATGATATFSTDTAGSVAQTSAAGPLHVTVNGGNVTFSATQHLASLSIASGATATLTAGGNKALVTGSVASAGRLDIGNNKLITQSPAGTFSGSTYTGVTGAIQSGYAGGDWSGSGIVTSMSAATGGNTLTSIGVASNADLGYTTFAGQTVTPTDTLVMYTYGGDANLDGAITGDDYFQIDSGFPAGAHGWFNGDFNYDGSITGDDYFIIDSNFPAQGAAFPTAAGQTMVQAVPEPMTGAICAAAALMISPRQRRRRR